MNSFEFDLHGPDEQDGIYNAVVHYDDNVLNAKPGALYLKVETFKREESHNLPQDTIEIVYHPDTKEYEPLNEGDDQTELYASIILMLEETVGSCWGNVA